ncbi:MAG: M28 family peptidase [Gemmatimonadales bacterium]|nr:M28 family peptidase [Gemmatimonadales bacterium]
MPASVRRAAETITEADFRARIGVLAHDSMRGRDTPSPQLERAATWVASEFRRFGLTPAGDNGSYLQYATLRRTRPDSASAVTVSGNGVATTLRLGREIAFLGGPPPRSRTVLPVVLMAGVPADLAHPFGDVTVRGKAVILFAPPDQLRNNVLNPLMTAATTEGVAAWIVASDVPEEQWSRLSARSLAGELWDLHDRPQGDAQDGTPLFFVQHTSMGAFLSATDEDAGALMSPAVPEVRELAEAELALEPVWNVTPELRVPNVVGMLEGSDPTLRDEAIVFVAHMDHVGVTADGRCAALGADSICNGANDNASGTAGVIELAEAYASMQPRPRRTMVFVTVAGEERGLLGAYYYTDHPAVPLARTVAAINFDMLVRNDPESIQLVAKEYSTLGTVADRVAGEHPELRMTPVVDPEQHGFAFQSSDHYPFAVRGVPVLFFFTGLHPDLHGPTDSPENADFDKGARVARLAFYIGLDVANADTRPQWDPAARAKVMEGAGGH